MIAARLRLVALGLALIGLCGAASCGGLPIVGPAEEPGVPPAEEVAGSQILANAGGGDLPVHGASLYSAGQKIFRELRQQETLNAFLDCRGEPDLVRVAPEARKVTLTYRRRGMERKGTVDITWSPHGYWVAGPLKPLGLPGAAPAPAPAPPKATPAPTPRPAPPPEAGPESPAGQPTSEETETPESPEAPETPPAPEEAPAPPGPQPTEAQRYDCPIEPWRADCKQLCVEGATWEWCEYGKKQ